MLIQTYPWCSAVNQTVIKINSVTVCLSAVFHGNNLLVFGGTGIPFGENNGNDVHVCNVQYKRWNLLNCRGKKPNKIYGQVCLSVIVMWLCHCVFCPQTSLNILHFPGNGHYKWLPLCVWGHNRLPLQHWPAQAGPHHQGVDAPQTQQRTHRSTWREVRQHRAF